MAPVSMRRERKDIDTKLSLFGLTGSLRMSNALARVLKASSAWGWVFYGDKRKDDELSHRNALYYYCNNFQHRTYCQFQWYATPQSKLSRALFGDSLPSVMHSLYSAIWMLLLSSNIWLPLFKVNTSESSNYCSMLPQSRTLRVINHFSSHIKLKLRQLQSYGPLSFLTVKHVLYASTGSHTYCLSSCAQV